MTEPTDKPLLDDQQLDEYLKGDSSVSRQYRQLPGEDVPASLDRLVLRQAEDAVKRPSRPAWMRWAKPLAVAASAVLVVSIVVETGLKEETMVTSQSVQAPIETRMIEESTGAPPPPPKAEAPPPVVFVEPIEAPALADAAPIEAPTFAEPAPAAAAPAPAPAPERKALSRQSVAGEAANAEIQEQLTKAEQEDKAASAADASRQKSAREEDAREQDRSVAQRAAIDEQKQAAGARASESTAVLSYSRPISSTANDMATLEKAYTDPEAWLKDIRQLRKDNKQDEADREWRRFREAFPNYEVAEADAAREAKK